MNGTLYHASPLVCPGRGEHPHFMQLYVINGHDAQLDVHMQASSFNELDLGAVSLIQGFLNKHNSYVQKFCTAK